MSPTTPDRGGQDRQGFNLQGRAQVSVVSAKKDTAGQDPIEGSPGDPTAIITVKITNGTAMKVAAGDVWVDVSYDSKNGDLASDLYEFNGLVGTISSGRSKMAKYEFLFEDKKGLNDLVIEVTRPWITIRRLRGCRQVTTFLGAGTREWVHFQVSQVPRHPPAFDAPDIQSTRGRAHMPH